MFGSSIAFSKQMIRLFSKSTYQIKVNTYQKKIVLPILLLTFHFTWGYAKISSHTLMKKAAFILR